MPDSHYTDDQLLSYLDEMLPVEQMTAIEKRLRNSLPLKQRLAGLSQTRNPGVFSVGEVWRRERVSCPNRQQLGSYLLGTLDSDFADYLDFHIRSIGCRICAANLYDLEQSVELSSESQSRRRKFFQSSAGYLQAADGER